MFVALTLACQAVPLPPVGFSLFRLAGLPVILSGFLLGPRAGFWVGAISDVLGFVLYPKGQMFFPGFMLTQALTGMLPALLVGKRGPDFRRYLWSIAISQGITKVLMVPFFLAFLQTGFGEAFSVAFKVAAAQGFVCQVVHIPLYAWICYLIMRVLMGTGSTVLLADDEEQVHAKPVAEKQDPAEPATREKPSREKQSGEWQEAMAQASGTTPPVGESVSIYGRDFVRDESGQFRELPGNYDE